VKFDVDRFSAAEWAPRTRGVPVPGLAEFFDTEDGEDKKPEWVVRGLTANELSRVHSASGNRKDIGAVLEAFASGTKTDKVREIQKAMGFTDDVHAEVAKRLEMLVLGSVDPVCPLEVAVRLAEVRPIEFFDLTTVISELTGLGSETKKKS
jgi:hypothetical protein